MLRAGGVLFDLYKTAAPYHHGVACRPSAETAVKGVNTRGSLELKTQASCIRIGFRDAFNLTNLTASIRMKDVHSKMISLMNGSCESIRKWELDSGVGGSEAYSTKEKVQTKARACAYTNHLSNVNGEAASMTKPERVGKLNKKKAAKDSDMPKRPPSAYLIFMETFRKTFKEENPDVKGITASAKAGGEKWLQLSDEEKAPYISEAAKRKAKYETAMATYKNGSAKQAKGVQN